MRCKRSWPCCLALAAAVTGAFADLPPELLLLSRFKQQVRQDLERAPNYTCLETMARYKRATAHASFAPADTVRLEVSYADGKELFAWPGSKRFEDRALKALVPTGMSGTGTFVLQARNLFVSENATFEYRGEETLDGRRAIRYDYHLPSFGGSFTIRTLDAEADVASKGSFFFDPASLDLIRLDIHGDEIPLSLHLEAVTISTTYARVPIGGSQALLPKKSELTMTHFAGDANRNVTEFSECHEYGSESVIRFDAPAEPLPEPAKPAIREVSLPSSLTIQMALESAIDSKSASVGDAVRARVLREVRIGPDLVLPKGAALNGRIVRMQHSPPAGFAVGIDFAEAEWDNVHAKVAGSLLDIDLAQPAAKKLLSYFDGSEARAVIGPDSTGIRVFYIKGKQFQIAPGLRLIWRTGAAAGS
jgi:hypothetical protein